MSTRRLCVIVVAAATAAGLARAGAEPGPAGRERCYGVALAGENDGLARFAPDHVEETEAAGSARVDYQGDAWVWLPAGTCLTLLLPDQPDGTPRRGAPEPLTRDAR
jgi:uncharacterized membrane protein